MIHRRTKFIALIALLSFLGSVLVYGGFEWYIYQMKANLYESRLMAAESEMRTRAQNTLEATITASKDEREKLSTYILKEEDIIRFLDDIEIIGKEQGVTLTTQTIDEATIDDTFESLSITVLLEGTFDGIMRTIRIFENLPLQSNVHGVTLSRGERDGGWSASMQFSVTKYVSTP